VLRLYDRTIGGLRVVKFEPRMSVYVCGITPYESAHLGHAFTFVHFDILVRYLRHLGAEVVHCQNVTDVDDDILRVARERGVDYQDLARREVESFERDMRAIGVKPPTLTPRATEFIPEMIEEVQALESAGAAYERRGWVYFRVKADPGYGKLSGFDRDHMVKLAAERGGNPDDPNKDDPLDVVLWQPSAPGEPEWPSPWGPGRPGWHVECSTMARRLLGQPVDIHGGGADLVYPHHESEMAQAEVLPGGRPFVRHWMHVGEVFQDGDKMSKSLGNMTFVRDLLERHEPVAIRRMLLQHHYRREWEFRPQEAFQETYLDEAEIEDPRTAFFLALDDDLDTPLALYALDMGVERDEDWIDEGRAILGLDM
jgi:L-cysteine:1D-myo-inositol 2-amino-2-deoxy-alpha-D-glucopyranoside ligase